MCVRYASNPKDILAGIGPSIGPDHYEIGPDVIAQVQESFGAQAEGLLVNRDKKVFFDLWKANQFLLEEAGVESIEQSALCTACNLQDWYSHRGEKGRTGRFGALLSLGG
jgi:copper oxidase (laccase) domain-containing protein